MIGLLPKGEANESSPLYGFEFPLHCVDAWFKSFQALLTALALASSAAVHDVVIMAAKFVTKLTFSQDDVSMRLSEITDRAIFTDLAQDEQQVRKCAKAFGIDTSDDADFPHQREMAKLIGAWRQAKALQQTRQLVPTASP